MNLINQDIHKPTETFLDNVNSNSLLPRIHLPTGITYKSSISGACWNEFEQHLSKYTLFFIRMNFIRMLRLKIFKNLRMSKECSENG